MSSRPSACETDTSPDLLHRFSAERDEAAFTRLVERHGPWMHGVALRMTGDAAAAQDLRQEAFALLVRKLPRCGSEAAFTAWLHRSLVYLTRNHLARERRRARQLRAWQNAEAAENMTPTDTPEIPESALRALDAAIQDLPAADRDLLLERHMLGRRWEDMATDRGASADALRKRGSRILERLAAILSRQGAVLPAAGLGMLLARPVEGSLSAAQSSAIALTACSAAARIPFTTLLSHTVLTMNAPKLILCTAALCALLFSVPLTMLTRRVSAAEEALAQSSAAASGMAAVQPAASGPPGTASSSKNVVTPSGEAQLPPEMASLAALSTILPGIAEGAAGPENRVNAALIEAVGAVMAAPDRDQRTAGLTFLLQWMRPADVRAVQAAIEEKQLPGVLYVNETNAVRERWAAIAGREAMEDYVQGDTAKAYNRLHAAIVRGWASTDPDGLQAWLKGLPPTCDWPERASPDMLLGLMRGDPDRATAMVLKSDERTIQAALPRIADAILQQQGLDGLEKWHRALPSTDETAAARAQTAYQLVEGRAFTTPAAALATLQSFDSEPWGGPVLASRIGARFGAASHERGLDLLGIMPADSTTTKAFSEALFTSLSKHQPNAAGTWLNAHRGSPWADHAAESLARAVQTSDLSAAHSWAATIRDPARRAAVTAALPQLKPQN